METVVQVVLTGDFFASLTARDDFGNSRTLARFQSEVEASFLGWNRSPQQTESLAAAVRPV